MRIACKSIVIIGVLVATALTVSCSRGRSSAMTADSSSQKQAPSAIRYEDHIWAAGLAPPAGDLSRPKPASPQSPKDGAALFSAMNCDGCHASDGSGQVGPSLSDGRWRYGGRDEEIFASIFYGRPQGMPAYGGVVGQDGVWVLVSFLKSLPKPASVPTVSAPETH